MTFGRLLILLSAFGFCSDVSAQTTDGPQHDELTYIPQPQSATDYTKGSARLGEIPGQDLVRPLGGGGSVLGDFATTRPANATTSTVRPVLPHLLTTRQTAALDRDPATGLPLDVATRASQSLADYMQTPDQRAQAEADALSGSQPH